MKAWVIGSRGMVGRRLIASLKRKGIDVIGTTSQEVDVTDFSILSQVGSTICPTHIFNCAAYTAVDKAEMDREKAFLVNTQGASFVAQCATQLKAHLIHLSTDYVFSGHQAHPYKEDDLMDPLNFYGWTKQKGEKEVLFYCPQSCIVRTSWVFEKGGKGFFSQFLEKLFENASIQAVSDQYSRLTYCPDLVEALYLLCNETGIVHFANGEMGSRYTIGLELLSFLKNKGISTVCQEVVPIEGLSLALFAPRPKFSVLDTSLFRTITGITPRSYQEVFETIYAT